ncbi:MAG TPA: hypothetical protein VFK02_01305 [Kofleriaceae bacterium]|nr:hypothetical protein [Kofleriaceae bacterium]
MHKRSRRTLAVLGAAGLGLTALLVRPAPVSGFTQSGVATFFGSLVPMGHEWITRMAGMELLGGDPVIKPDPDDPRKHWTKGLAKDTDLHDAQNEVKHIKDHKISDSRYQSTYEAVYAAIIGERWVDIAGFNVTKSTFGEKLGGLNCFDDVAQEPVDVQYDHFMRRYDDRGGSGGVGAAQKSRERFVDYFVTAAASPGGIITVWDGGGTSALVTVDRNYFLFGRAVHLFEDSFSSEHTVRIDSDNYEKVRQVKSYLCAAGSEQHSHSQKEVIEYRSGDVVWKPGTRFDSGWKGYKASNMKTVALVGTEGMKDLWAAFIRTMNKDDKDRADTARKEANRLADTWLDFEHDEVTRWYDDESHRDATYVLAPGQAGKGQTVQQCMQGLKVGTDDQDKRASQIEDHRRTCLYNILPVLGFSDAQDPELKMPYNWQWRATTWKTPPADWKLPDVKVPSEIKVKIKSAKTKDYMVAPDGIANNHWIYVKNGEPLQWIVVGDRDHAIFRLATAPLFLSYRLTTGAVKLYDSASDAEYKIGDKDDKDTLYNLRYKDYLWLDGKSPYVSGKGDPKNDNARWKIDGLPDHW